MASNTEIVTGFIVRPNGEPFNEGVVRFSLTSVDTDGNEVIAHNESVDFAIAADGSIAVELWPNTLGEAGSSYTVQVREGATGRFEIVGRIQVGTAGPYSLAALLRADIPAAQNTFYSVLTQDEYNAFLADMAARLAAAEAARDAAGVSASNALTSANNAATSAASASSTAASLTGLDLSAIAASKAVTAVDVFVYDTSKDSDGGAWRNRTQGTSWYNEALNTATRGSRKDFPAVAVIVAEADKVTIYDGDDPALPMWMVFDGGSSADMLRNVKTSVAALNGLLSAGLGSSGFATANFLSDGGYFSTGGSGFRLYGGNVSQRNEGLSFSSTTSGGLANNVVNDVAMTVLPDAPIDYATGLQTPTIAVATGGGVSVINGETVVDSGYNSVSNTVVFDTNAGLWYGDVDGGAQVFFATFIDIQNGDGFGDVYANTTTGQEFKLLAKPDSLEVIQDSVVVFGGANPGGSAVEGLAYRQPNYPDQTKGMSALLTSSYNTGWMPGNIKGAFLADTDATALVGSGELVTNGTFDTNIAGWTASGNASISLVSNRLRVTTNSGSNGSAYQAFATVIGGRYVISLEQTQTSSRVLVGTTSGNGNILTGGFTTGTNLLSFTAVGTTTFLTLQSAGSAGQFSDFDNVSVKLADADRSVNNKGLAINGTITRTAVATGAELVGYSGFSATNYLEQPYNSDLDFGTGDFSIMGWVKSAAIPARLCYRGAGASGANRLIVDIAGTGNKLRLITTDGGGSAVICESLTGVNDAWQFVSGIRKGGVLSVYVNGTLENTSASTNDVSNSVATTRIGVSTDGAGRLSGSMALWRISATVPSAAQIAKIYQDEAPLFQAGAACTLYGTSDAVTALAHDPVTDLLHVGTSAGRSVFDGLRRVSNTTVAVGTAISASNNLIVEE